MTQTFVSMQDVSRDFVRRMTPVQAALARFGAPYRTEVVHAVDGVTAGIGRGRILGLVGESGCGKSTLGRVVAGLIRPTTGSVHLDGRRFDLAGNAGLSVREQLRVQMVFQNPMASLNPRQRVIDIVTEGAVFHGIIRRGETESYARELLAEVGLSADALFRLPHQFSGGQRQRIGIARALSTRPDFLVCDEPVAALDVSIQAQVINLLLDLKERRDLTLLFISHDLGVIRYICDDVAVMYLGRIVEQGPVADLFANPRHPYTRALLAEMPRIATGHRAFQPITGEIPSPLDPPPGCQFHPRCPVAEARCRTDPPGITSFGPEHRVACHLAGE